MKQILYILLILTGLACQPEREASLVSGFSVEDSLEIGAVPSGFPVDFCLLTNRDDQYVAYFDSLRRMTVASRKLDSPNWTYKVLPSKTGWDSHNYITMAIDKEGQLHVSGNMHNVPLIYFRTEKPGDINTLTKLNMTGDEENRVTYPKFLTDHEGNLVFNYRNGGSGNGKRIWNIYDVSAKSWSRLLDRPLLDGEGERNAYPMGPVGGEDGWFHLVWVWRDTPDCATNHHLSYARSRDLVQWESAFGQALELPITLDKKELWVDAIPSGGGIINGCEKLFFDEMDRPIVSYHKSDEEGNMQIYAARAEGNSWVIHKLSDWQKPIVFGGKGSMGFIGIRISELSRHEPGVLTMTYRHRDYGEGRLVVDEETLSPLSDRIDVVPEYPDHLDRVRSDFEGMGIRRSQDIGISAEASVKYILQWETLGRNFDRPRKEPLPEPAMLRLYKLKEN